MGQGQDQDQDWKFYGSRVKGQGSRLPDDTMDIVRIVVIPEQWTRLDGSSNILAYEAVNGRVWVYDQV